MFRLKSQAINKPFLNFDKGKHSSIKFLLYQSF